MQNLGTEATELRLNNSQGQSSQTNIHNAGHTIVFLHTRLGPDESMASDRRSLSLLQEELRNQIKDQTGSIRLTNHPPHPVILDFLSLEQTCLQRAQLENVCLIKLARSWRDALSRTSHAPVYHSTTMTFCLF